MCGRLGCPLLIGGVAGTPGMQRLSPKPQHATACLFALSHASVAPDDSPCPRALGFPLVQTLGGWGEKFVQADRDIESWPGRGTRAHFFPTGTE
jgi:hypothetical protein